MSDNIATITSADGRFRVSINGDPYAENPRAWAEPLTGALTVAHPRYYPTPAAGPLADQWDRLRDVDADRAVTIMERYVRLRGGVSAILTPHDGPTTLFYLTPAMMESAGFGPDDITAARMSELLESERIEYRSWGEGDVYVVRVEERATWQRTDAGHGDETMGTWEWVDSIAGIIGYRYAEEEARRMLADAVGVTVTPAAFTDGNAVTTTVTCPGCDQLITVTDTAKTECGGEGEGDCGESCIERPEVELAHQSAVEQAAPFLD